MKVREQRFALAAGDRDELTSAICGASGDGRDDHDR
jgi:hypothetical protein